LNSRGHKITFLAYIHCLTKS